MIWFSSLYAYCLTKCVGQFRLTNSVLFSTLLTVHLSPIGGCSGGRLIAGIKGGKPYLFIENREE